MLIKEEYRNFSWHLHKKAGHKPIVVQIELTYRCPIHCVYCYVDCYNNTALAKNEISTKDVQRLMDKLYDAGCLWLTFTGGDPMIRDDFLKLYDYAKNKGFIFSVMTSLVSLNDAILQKMSEKPPFSISMTLNGVTEKTYEKISQVKGSFKKVMTNIDKVLKARLPLEIKTLISKSNIHEVDKIRKFIESRNLTFSSSALIFARLNGDVGNCRHRLSVDDVMKISFSEKLECAPEPEKTGRNNAKIEVGPQTDRFYKCAVGNGQWCVNPQGRLHICSYVREPSYDLLKGDVALGVRLLSDYVKNEKFSKDFECRHCKIWHLCQFCPGKAKLEVGDEEKVIPYFCELAKKKAKKLKIL